MQTTKNVSRMPHKKEKIGARTQATPVPHMFIAEVKSEVWDQILAYTDDVLMCHGRPKCYCKRKP